MNSIKNIFRFFSIGYVLAKNGMDKVAFSLPFFSSFRFISYLNPWHLQKKTRSQGEALRSSLEELGPIFVKFGQALSTRPDILPEDIAFELSKLQDKVAPFSSEQAIQIITQTYGMPPEALFAFFDPIPMASASMAQVHAATLKTGEEVVVKILRPNIQKIIQQDIHILYAFARFAYRYWPESRRLKPIEIVREFERTLLDELDLLREAANGAQLRRHFNHSPLLYIPEMHWSYARQNVLVMERIRGIPISDLSQLRDQGINIKKLAERGVEIFFTQVFRDRFFHADMHPGNIYVSYEHKENPQYICIDFGIIGTLNDNDQRYLAHNLIAFFNRDYQQVAKLHIESGWVRRDTRIEEFESAIRTVCEPIFEKPLKDISFAQVVLKLFQVARRFHMEVQPQLVLLQKTLLAIEGLGRQLYPELDLWATAKPFLERWVKEQVGPKNLIHQLQQNLPFFVEQLPHLPQLMYEVLSLQKESLLLNKEPPTVVKKQNQDLFSMVTGICITLGTLSTILYFNLLPLIDPMTCLLTGTGISAFLLLLWRKRT
ncbi:MAG: ubiquinone biosynthesis regulatory protein kinase UbiB [Legionella sp.]|nr:MAG: ubiquinone biosynthesis regulatory protein kinase UbiB [Legionella sp.]PJD97429.1 MAG: ubiquinone biosynthesis regulatory protein kinase UbiB [Legionella sp.]